MLPPRPIAFFNTCRLSYTMVITRKGYAGLIPFVLYFILLVLFPVTHCHAADGLAEKSGCSPGHGPEHLLFLCGEHCCEFHESDHTRSDEFHIHFLIDDQGIAAARNQSADASQSPHVLTIVDAASHVPCPAEGFASFFSGADFLQEAILSHPSGLSPPLS